MRARYVPFAHGKYEVAANLKLLGHDFGNGEMDKKVFQFDEDYPRYLETKTAGRKERLEKYYPQVTPEDLPVTQGIADWMASTLIQEYPKRFQRESFYSGHNGRSGEDYRDSFDAVVSQIQEDSAILRRDPADPSREWLAAIHLSFPNHWSAEDKIRRPFTAVHAPVPGFGQIARSKDAMVDLMVRKGPFVRFAWGVATDRELNHHPQNEFQGRAFDAARPELFVRVERQTLTSFTELSAALFTIRTYFLDVGSDLMPGEQEALARAIESMKPESLVYKGLKDTREPILKWIRGLSCP